MNPRHFLRSGLIAFVASGALAACDRDTAQRTENAANTAGQKVERALDKTQEKLSQAGAELKPQLERAGEKISAAAEKTGAQISAATERASEKLNSPETRAAVNDSAITASIKADIIKDPDLSVLKIDVDTHDGVVVLNGLAGTEAARKRAEQIAGSVKGVREVRNHLTVKKA
jgi:hyperosmotically inducible protein